MTRRRTATRVEEAQQRRGEDRIAVIERSDRTLIVVADGAGGVAGGAAAADWICGVADGMTNDCAAWLSQQDTALAESGTGLVAVVGLSIADDGSIRGASVGDCEAWIFGPTGALNLTARQVRKPLVGDGAAAPISFVTDAPRGTLIVATDGLWKYVRRARIADVAPLRPLETALSALVEAARLPNGDLQDDLAIAICDLQIG